MRKMEINCKYQPYIEHPPVAVEQLYAQSASNDAATIKMWYQIWLDNMAANKEFFGSFADYGVGKLFGKYKHGTVLLAGSGPSLKYNGHQLAKKRDVPLFSCLHNFHFMEDNNVDVDYYVSLDAGPVVLEEVSEGGSRTPDEYWELTKKRTLLAFIGTNPELFKKWQGDVYLFNAPIPDESFIKKMHEIEVFSTMVSNGGNVLGACLYLAKGIFGAHRVAFVGADFSFCPETNNFHPWKSKYDAEMGHIIPLTDVFGNRVYSWPSYNNFKCWFDQLSQSVRGDWMINCTEGGCLGSYQTGNLRAIQQLTLQDFLSHMHMGLSLKEQCDNPEKDIRQILF